ncbi:hypothetical protein [Prosthecobacter sp.]
MTFGWGLGAGVGFLAEAGFLTGAAFFAGTAFFPEAAFLMGAGFLTGAAGFFTAAGFFLAAAFLGAGFLAMILVRQICFNFREASNIPRSLSRFLVRRWPKNLCSLTVRNGRGGKDGRKWEHKLIECE